MPFHSRLRVRHGTDRQTDTVRQTDRQWPSVQYSPQPYGVGAKMHYYSKDLKKSKTTLFYGDICTVLTPILVWVADKELANDVLDFKCSKNEIDLHCNCLSVNGPEPSSQHRKTYLSFRFNGYFPGGPGLALRCLHSEYYQS